MSLEARRLEPATVDPARRAAPATATTRRAAREPWWGGFFGTPLAQMFLEREPAENAQIASFIARHLCLGPGSHVLDQCCGIGSVAVALAQQGISVHGIDQAETYIAQATLRASQATPPLRLEPGGGRCHFEVADAFGWVSPILLDGGFSWGCSFGMGATEADDLAMLACMVASVRPGRRVLLDVQSGAHVRAHFKPLLLRTRETAQGTLHLARHARLEAHGTAMVQRWVWTLPDGQQQALRSRMHLYEAATLVKWLEALGCQVCSVHGGLHGEPPGPAHSRLILVAERGSASRGVERPVHARLP